MLYCIELKRGGIGEEDVVLHEHFDKTPTKKEVIEYIKDLDYGWQDGYCDVDYYKVG